MAPKTTLSYTQLYAWYKNSAGTIVQAPTSVDLDAASNLTTLAYDNYDRVSQVQFPMPTTGSNASNPGDYEGYGYDNNGNVTTKRLRSGDTVTFSYDALNRATSAVFPAGKSQNVYWGNDLLNRGLYARYGSASGPGVSYAYDALGRATSETSVNKTLAYRYDAAGNRTQVTWPETGANALHVVYVYDVLNRVTQVQENGATSGPGLLATYAYDSLGRRSAVARAGGPGAGTAYAYDAASRLYTLTQTLAGSASVTYTLGYNAAGQVLTKQVSNGAYVAHPASLTAGYVANGLNQYVSVTGVTASYTPANSAALSYDPAGRLQSETTAGATTSLLYSGDALVGEYTSSGAIVSRYVMGPGQDEPLVWYQGAGTSTRRWLTADNQGSVIGYADGSGNSGATYTYGPYGEPIVSGGASAWGGSRYRFTGQIEIPEAQLYYYKARVYDPNMGRFYQTDPAGLASDTNLYAYATEDPVNGSDPSGMDDDPPENLQCENGCFSGGPDAFSSDPLILGSWTECQPGSPGGSCGISVSSSRSLLSLSLAWLYYSVRIQDSGGSGGGGGKGSSPQNNLKKAVCAAIPDARTASVTGGLGGIGSGYASGTALMNYNSGAISLYATGGGQLGWNGGASATISAGVVYGLGGNNSGYSGAFTGANASIPAIPVGINSQTGGGVTEVGLQVGENLTPLAPSGGITRSVTSAPLNVGNILTSGSLLDMAIMAAKNLACH